MYGKITLRNFYLNTSQIEFFSNVKNISVIFVHSFPPRIIFQYNNIINICYVRRFISALHDLKVGEEIEEYSSENVKDEVSKKVSTYNQYVQCTLLI